MIQEQRELVNGKPHFGVWLGKFISLNRWDEKMVQFAKDRLKIQPVPDGCQKRNETFIERPPCFSLSIHQTGTVGCKFIVWGRAFKIMSIFSKKAKRTKKMYIGGKRRRKRIDR